MQINFFILFYPSNHQINHQRYDHAVHVSTIYGIGTEYNVLILIAYTDSLPTNREVQVLLPGRAVLS